MPTTDLVEVGAIAVQVEGGNVLRAGAVTGAGEHHQGVSGPDHLAGAHQGTDSAHRVGRGQDVLHFHGFQHDQLRARRAIGPFGRNLDHGAGQLRPQHLLTRIQFERASRVSCRRDCAAPVKVGRFSSMKPVVIEPV